MVCWCFSESRSSNGDGCVFKRVALTSKLPAKTSALAKRTDAAFTCDNGTLSAQRRTSPELSCKCSRSFSRGKSVRRCLKVPRLEVKMFSSVLIQHTEPHQLLTNIQRNQKSTADAKVVSQPGLPSKRSTYKEAPRAHFRRRVCSGPRFPSPKHEFCLACRSASTNI